ncbi:unnamed protein product [Diatraea saccharalis]|uniref:Uncharacterized protein n=1 Tax=Diatraea saccharalis TaxID=40085 RepID=A0A9N9RAP0_9NEOP|nr:unnamed protein product [Diatraea saccharalis]
MSETSDLSDFRSDDDQSEYEPPPPPRKRKKKLKNENLWKKNVRKLKRSLGEEYTSARGKKVSKKVFKHVTTCCSKKCCIKLDQNAQRRLFCDFWNIGDKAHQDSLLLSCLEKVSKLRENVGPGKLKRDNQWKYFLTVDGLKINICRKLLLSLLKISENG